MPNILKENSSDAWFQQQLWLVLLFTWMMPSAKVRHDIRQDGKHLTSDRYKALQQAKLKMGPFYNILECTPWGSDMQAMEENDSLRQRFIISVMGITNPELRKIEEIELLKFDTLGKRSVKVTYEKYLLCNPNCS